MNEDVEMVRCSNGHRVPRTQMLPRGRGRVSCPECVSAGLAPLPRRWSPAALSPVLWLVAVAEALLALGQYFGLRDYADSLHLTVSQAHADEFIWTGLGHLALALAAAIAATVVRRA